MALTLGAGSVSFTPMSREPFLHKTILIAGADTPMGRSLALQFTRAGAKLILCGASAELLARTEKDVLDKHGDPLVAVVTESGDAAMSELAEKRSAQGHVHGAINLAATVDEPGYRGPGLARLYARLILQLVEGRGTIRMATVWPDAVPDPPLISDAQWHSWVRIGSISSAPSGDLGDSMDNGIRAASVAEAIVNLLRCPPGACPVEVRLEARRLKSQT